MLATAVEYRYRWLPIVFLIGLGLPRFVERTWRWDVALSVLTAVVLATALLAVWSHRRIRWLALALMVPSTVLTAAHNLTDQFNMLAPMLVSAFLLVVTCTLIYELLDTEDVGIDTLLAAASIYLLTAVLWAALYMIVAVTYEGSFIYAEQIVRREFDPVAIADGLRMDDFYYYSVTTLTTAGLGDISPVTDPAQFLTALEALVGQLFLVVFVAHLVGLRTALGVERRRERYRKRTEPVGRMPEEETWNQRPAD